MKREILNTSRFVINETETRITYMKGFSLRKAKRGARLVTQDGKPAKFIAHVQRAKKGHRLLVMVRGEVWRRQTDGRHCPRCSGLVYPAILLADNERKGSRCKSR